METKNNHVTPTYHPMGDQALVIQFENIVSLEVSKRVHALTQRIKQSKIAGVKDLFPAFNNLTVCYDPVIIQYDQLIDTLQNLSWDVNEETHLDSKTIHVPVVFGGEYGPDLDEIAERAGLSSAEVVELLTSQSFLVYMIGFIAGYAYCGDIDPRLSFPRRANPRQKVRKGTIQIVNQQTGIFTMTAPSGWHLVGWTPMEMFNPYANPPSLLAAGNYLRYVPIQPEEAESWNERRQREWDEQWNSSK